MKINAVFHILVLFIAVLTFSAPLIARAQQDSGIAEVETGTEEKARELRKGTGESHWSIGFCGTFALPIEVSTLGYRLGWSYELPSYAVEVEGRLVSGKNEIREFGSPTFHETRKFGFAAFSVGGIYFFFNKWNISPYLGGGLTAARASWERRTWHSGWHEDGALHEHGASSFGRGIGVYAIGGIQMLRTTQNRLKLELRVDQPFFLLQGASDVFFQVTPITIGLFLSRHYVPGESSCFLF